MMGMRAACRRAWYEAVLADAAGAAGLDVVRAERADHVGADQPQEDAGGEQAEGEGGQHGVREHVAERGHVAAADRVDASKCPSATASAVSASSVAGVARPATGSQPSQTEKISLSSRPAKKTGVA